MEPVRRTYGVQEMDILVHANVLQGTNLSTANALQQLCDTFSKRPHEVLTEEPKLYVQIMFRVVVAPINLVPPEEGSLSRQYVFLSWYDAQCTKIVGWGCIVILPS